MKKLPLIVLFCITALSGLYAASLASVFPNMGAEYIGMLKQGTTLSNSTLDGGISHIVPSGSLIAGRAEEAGTEENSFSVAITAFAPYPESFDSMSQEERMLVLLNILTSVSTQKGTTYISRTAGNKSRILIEESYCIQDPSSPNARIDDPVFTSLPDSLVLYSYQKDNRFGGNTFVLDYTVSENEIFMKVTNHTDMKFLGISCVKPQKLSMFIDVFCTDDGLVVSCLATVYDRNPTITILFYTVDIENSFKRRIIGLKDWFIEELME